MADEILVHISAPTTRQNDELYRSLASAYLDFKPRAVYGGAGSAEPSEQSAPRDATLKDIATPSTKHSNASLDTSISSIGKDPYGSFPSNISFGGQECLGSRPYHVSPEYGSPISRLARLDHIYQNWQDQTTSRGNTVIEKSQVPQTPQELDDADTAFIEDSQFGTQVVQSQLFNGYSTTDEDTDHGDEGKDRVEDTDNEEVDRVEETEIMSFDGNMSDQSGVELTSDVEPTMSELQSSVHADSPPEDTGSSADNSEHTEDPPSYGTLDYSFLQHGNNEASIQAIDASLSRVDFSALPLHAFAPEPEISVLKPSTLPSQITKSLSALKTQNPKRFQPCKRQRIPKHDERGHWIVDCVSWPQILQQGFWNSLYEHVCSGKIGWGATLHRDAKSPEMLGLVRLYCWGEVVEHMWLLLWLCSQGRISGSKTKWIDASGITVFEVA